MVNRAALSPEALAWFDGLSREDRLTLCKSNKPLEDLNALQGYLSRMSPHSSTVLYQTIPEPDVPSNQLLDELDSE